MMPAHMIRMRLTALALIGVSALALSACQTTGTTARNGTAAPGKVTADATYGPSLSSLEKQYKADPDNTSLAVRYARALRDAGRLSRASIVMAPFAKDTRKPSAAARTEFSAIQTSLGNYGVAEEYARKALAMNDKSSESWHMLGIAIDAQGKHPEAETAFRKALELNGESNNPAPILNNLGLNLAAQGFLDEAAEALRKALETAPNREEIERNLRIVSALRESGGRAPSYMQTARDKKNAEAAKNADEKTDKKSDKKSAKAVDPDAAYVPPAKAGLKKPVPVAVVKDPAPRPAAKDVPVPSYKPGSFN